MNKRTMENKVVITQNASETLAEFLNDNKYSKLFVIADTNTKLHCYPLLREVLTGKGYMFTILPGEEQKNLQTCTAIWKDMTEVQLDRKALVINLGGGVIGDMGGFCASTYKRGIDFIQIPTTLLSQVDASVGGKLGIDFTGNDGFVFKNHIGVFRVPDLVIIDTNFLNTLDKRELRSGFAEVIKHCLIADKQKWDVIKRISFENQDWSDLVAHSVVVKDRITTADPKETGLRKILNFGHTLGHAVESFYLNTRKKLLHGEAIAVGMITESYLSVEKGFISMEEHKEIEKYILEVYGKFELPIKDIKKIVPLTLQDKKNENSSVMFSLLKNIGEANFNIVLTAEEMEKALLYYSGL